MTTNGHTQLTPNNRLYGLDLMRLVFQRGKPNISELPGMVSLILGRKPLFPLGQLVATSGAMETLSPYPGQMLYFLALHVSGDWGDMCDEDLMANDLAIDSGLRILSAYMGPGGTRIYIITEADRSATTVLLPEEY